MSMWVYKLRTKSNTVVRLYGATPLRLQDALDRLRDLAQSREPNMTDEDVVAFHQDTVEGPLQNGRG